MRLLASLVALLAMLCVASAEQIGTTGIEGQSPGTPAGGTGNVPSTASGNTVFAGPTSAGMGIPSFRVLVPADINLLSNIRFGVDISAFPVPSEFTLSGNTHSPLVVNSQGSVNAIIGASVLTPTTPLPAFPAGVTGYGMLQHSGGNVEGFYGQCDQYTAGICDNEIGIFNYSGPPTTNLPPNRGIGTPDTVPVGLTMACQGTFACAIGTEISATGTGSSKFLTGIYFDPFCCSTYGIFIDAWNFPNWHGPTTSAVLKNYGDGINLLLQTAGPSQPFNSVIVVNDANGNTNYSVRQDGDEYVHNAFMGGHGSTFSAGGNLVISPGVFATDGDAQSLTTVLRGSTSGAVSVRLTADGAGVANSFNTVPLPDNSVQAIHATIMAHDITTGFAASWTCDNVLIRRATGVATAFLVGTPTCTQVQADAQISASAVSITADTVIGCINITGTGVAGKSIRWIAEVRAVEG
jgi:hypothetical protein